MTELDRIPDWMQPNVTYEEWRDVAGFEGIYEVSNLGNVRRPARMMQRQYNKSKAYKQKKRTQA